MTRQEIFTKVATHLLTQNAQSRDGLGCAYRGEEGRMCAAGCLIPDELYTPGLEGASALDAKLVDVWKQLGISKLDQCFIKVLQVLHDAKPVEEWRDGLKKLAKAHKLKFPRV